MTQWLKFDTRELGDDRSSFLDGFVHVVPKSSIALHSVDIRCWCDTWVAWSEDQGGLVVYHRNKRRKKAK